MGRHSTRYPAEVRDRAVRLVFTQYRLVPEGRHVEGGDNCAPLKSGSLQEACFAEDGSGEWLVLTPETTGMASIADIAVFTRMAGSAVGATTKDRPEWFAAHPKGGDHTAAAFARGLFVVAVNPAVHDDAKAGSANVTPDNMFNSPDGLMFKGKDASGSRPTATARTRVTSPARAITPLSRWPEGMRCDGTLLVHGPEDHVRWPPVSGQQGRRQHAALHRDRLHARRRWRDRLRQIPGARVQGRASAKRGALHFRPAPAPLRRGRPCAGRAEAGAGSSPTTVSLCRIRRSIWPSESRSSASQNE